MSETPTRKRRVAVPGEAPAVQAVEPQMQSDLPAPEAIDSREISQAVLTAEGWLAPSSVPGGGR